MPVDISLAIERKVWTNDAKDPGPFWLRVFKVVRKGAEQEPAHLVAPGDVITRDSGFMRGHGTYMAPGEEVQNLIYVINAKQKPAID